MPEATKKTLKRFLGLLLSDARRLSRPTRSSELTSLRTTIHQPSARTETRCERFRNEAHRRRSGRSRLRGYAALDHSATDLRAHDDEEREDEHDDGDRDHLRQLAREAQGRVEVDRERHPRPDDERGDRILVERGRERD